MDPTTSTLLSFSGGSTTTGREARRMTAPEKAGSLVSTGSFRVIAGMRLASATEVSDPPMVVAS